MPRIPLVPSFLKLMAGPQRPYLLWYYWELKVELGGLLLHNSPAWKDIKGPILHPAQFTFYTVVANLHPAQS